MAKKNTNGFSPNVNLRQQIKLDIELKIIVGIYEGGKRIPSIPQIAELYNVCASTAQKVLEALCAENIILYQKGVGYYAKPFMREILTKMHINELKTRIDSIVEYGLKLGVNKSELIAYLTDSYDKATK